MPKAATLHWSRDTVESTPLPETSVMPKSTTLHWRRETVAPHVFTSLTGTAASNGSTAYFSCDHSIYCYTEADKKWKQLPPCTYILFGMAVINGQLTTIGGCIKEKYKDSETNVLLSLASNLFGKRSWKKVLPSMPTGRAVPAVTTTKTHLVVAGGWKSTDIHTNVVEVLNTESTEWSSVTYLPQTNFYPQMALSEGKLYVFLHECMLSCSLEQLLKSCQPTATATLRKYSLLWANNRSPTNCSASLVAIGEHHLLALGGSNDFGDPQSDIQLYDKTTDTWNMIGQTPSPWCQVLATTLQGNRVIVVGEKNEGGSVYIGGIN